MRKGEQRASGSAQMEPAWALWESGDVLAARKLARSVLSTPQGPEDAAEAKQLLDDARNPWRVLGWGFLALALVCALILIAVFRT